MICILGAASTEVGWSLTLTQTEAQGRKWISVDSRVSGQHQEAGGAGVEKERCTGQACMVPITGQAMVACVKLWFPLAASQKQLLGLVGALQLPRAGLLCEEGPEHKDRLVPEERTLEA